MSFTFTMDTKALNKLIASPGGEVQRDMRKRAYRLQALARAQVGKNTGRLATSIKVEFIRGPIPRWRVGSTNRVALLHHNGTRPHTITPRQSRALRFVRRGRIVHATVVRHPGTRPNRYLTDNLRRVA